MALEIVGKTIKNVVLQKDINGFNCAIIFLFDDVVLEITVNPETDELVITTKVNSNKEQVQFDPECKFALKIIGNLVVSYWISDNNMGYFDLLALGIGEALPTLIISCAASELKIREATSVL